MLFAYSLLLRRECCSFSNGEFVKAGLQELEQWCSQKTDEVPTRNFSLSKTKIELDQTQGTINCSLNWQFTGTSWDELQHIRQAVGFLV